MAYIAQQPLCVADAEGRAVHIAIGEEVRDFTDWSAPVRAALLNMGRVRNTARPNITVRDGRLVMHLDDAPHDEGDTLVAERATASIKCPNCDHPGFTSKASYQRHYVRKHARC